MVFTPNEVFRDHNTPGVPSSGDYFPPKPDIRAMLNSIIGGTAAVGDFRGAWDSGTDYIRGDLVEDGGSIWYSLQDNTNETPVEGADWTLFLPGGGAPSAGSVTPAMLDASQSAGFASIIVGETHIDVDVRYSGTDDDKIQDALDDEIGAILHLAPRQWSLTTQKTVGKVQKIEATGAYIDAPALNASCLFSVKIQSTGMGTTYGREYGIRGGNWYAPLCDHVWWFQSTTGISGSSDNTTGFPLLNMLVEHTLMESDFQALRITGIDNHTNKFFRNIFNSGFWNDITGDANKWNWNTCTGKNPNIVSLVAGAFNTEVCWNIMVDQDVTTSNGGGIIDVYDGDFIIMMGNQMEKSKANTNNPKSHIVLRGNTRPCRNNLILYNNFGATSPYIDTSVTVINGQDTLIDWNQFMTAAVQDVNLSSTAHYNMIGANNTFRGAARSAPVTPSSNTGTDVSRLMVINDQGKGNRGVIKAASLLSPGASWGLSPWMLDAQGDIEFMAKFVNGTLGTSTQIGSMPVGARPYEDHVMALPNDVGGFNHFLIASATGAITVLAIAATGTNSYAAGHKFPALYRDTISLLP